MADRSLLYTDFASVLSATKGNKEILFSVTAVFVWRRLAGTCSYRKTEQKSTNRTINFDCCT